MNNFSALVSYSKTLRDPQIGNCCSDNTQYEFTATIVPITEVVLQKHETDKSGIFCCYHQSFEVRIEGLFKVYWDFDLPFSVECVEENEYEFNEIVPACITVFCFANKWYYNLTICHFTVTCSHEELLSDCEGYDGQNICASDSPVALICAGMSTSWLSDIGALDAVDGPAFRYGEGICPPESEICPTGGYCTYWNIHQLVGGSGAFMGIYRADECSAQDKWEPCDVGSSEPIAAAMIYPSTPPPYFDCSYLIEDEYNCFVWDRLVSINYPTFTEV